jgi:hypothetical protein
MSDPLLDSHLHLNRRHFFGKSAQGLGVAALSSLFGDDLLASDTPALIAPDVAPKAKRMIYLFQSGAPSQQDLFDYKPKLIDNFGKELGDFVELNQRKTGMSAGQKSFPIAGTRYKFEKHGHRDLRTPPAHLKHRR